MPLLVSHSHASPMLPPCFPLASPLLPPYFPLTFLMLPSCFPLALPSLHSSGVKGPIL